MLNPFLNRALHFHTGQLAALNKFFGDEPGTWESIADAFTPIVAAQVTTTIENAVPVIGTVDALADLVTSPITATPAVAVTTPTSAPAPSRAASVAPITLTPPTIPAEVGDLTAGSASAPVTTVPVTGDISTANPATQPAF